MRLRNGEEVEIAHAREADAEEILRYVDVVAAESTYLTFGPGEFGLGLAQEAAFLRALGPAGTGFMLKAEIVARLTVDADALARVARLLAVGGVREPATAKPAEASRYLTTEQAAKFLGFTSTSGIRTAVLRDDLRPAGRGCRGSLLFTVDELERFMRARAARYDGRRRETPGQRRNADEDQRQDHTLPRRVQDRRQDVPDPGRGNDPRTGKRRQVERVLEGVTAPEAAKQRSALQEEIRAGNAGGDGEGRLRVGDYAKSWIESKARGVDAGTADRYVVALERHILPVLGDYYFDALTPMAVQEWLNEASRKTKPNTTKRYDAETVFGWWRVLRTMVRDAVEQLGLPRDPTRRIIIPELTPKGGNSLTIETLPKLLAVVRERHPSTSRTWPRGRRRGCGRATCQPSSGRTSTRRRG